MKKLLYTFLAASIIFSACKKEEEDEVVTPTVTVATVYDTLVGYWNLTQYDIGNGLTTADTGQYINFVDETDLMVNIQITGLTWFGEWLYEATSDSIHIMNNDYGLIFQSSQNMILSTEVGFFGTTTYHLYFEK